MMIPINPVQEQEQKAVPLTSISGEVPVVGIRFRKHGKIYYFSPNSVSPAIFEQVIVETKYGLELGTVIHRKTLRPSDVDQDEIYPIVRIASEKDIETMEHFAEKEDEAEIVCKEKVAQLALDMKVVSCLFSFNGSRITFYFTAEGRVDFRELVKVLTNHFRTKIELRQIGPREETKLLGGVGKCGRILCCHAWMNQFHSITLQYATDQLLSTKNIDKISGVCGRLLCCLEHEVDYYREQLETYPALQTEISTDKGKGKVIDINILQKKIKVLLQDKTIIEVDHSAS